MRKIFYGRVVVATFFMTCLFCSKPNFDMDFQMDIPSDVLFVFVPEDVDMKSAMINSYIEFNRSSSSSSSIMVGAHLSSLLGPMDWASGENAQAHGMGIKYALAIPSIKPCKVVSIQEYITLPDSLCDHTMWKDVNYAKFTRFSSSLLTSKLHWLDTMAVNRHCDVVLVGDCFCHIVAGNVEDESEKSHRRYLVKVYAVLGVKSKP